MLLSIFENNLGEFLLKEVKNHRCFTF